MQRHEFLRHLHRVVAPANYLEIGVSEGQSLALSRVPSVAIDPAFTIRYPLHCDLDLVKATSDDFFARRDPIRHLRSGRNPIRNHRRGRPLLSHYQGGTIVDLAFVDGMHLFEFVLRDFMNVERFSHWTSVIVFDDMLPREVIHAAREKLTVTWTGDVYKLIPVLRTYRPDLTLLPIDTEPTGVLVVVGADPTNRVLHDRYDEIVGTWVVPDPQPVPDDILERHRSVDPDALIGSDVWRDLVRARSRRTTRERRYAGIRDRLTALVR